MISGSFWILAALVTIAVLLGRWKYPRVTLMPEEVAQKIPGPIVFIAALSVSRRFGGGQVLWGKFQTSSHPTHFVLTSREALLVLATPQNFSVVQTIPLAEITDSDFYISSIPEVCLTLTARVEQTIWVSAPAWTPEGTLQAEEIGRALTSSTSRLA
jgi:hypothetical protein